MRIKISAILAFVLATCSCAKYSASPEQEAEPVERQEIILTRQQQEIISKGNSFAFDFFSEVCRREAEAEVFLSPFSMEAALSMLCNGAGGSTYSQIASVLGFEGLGKAEIDAAYRALLSALLSADNTTTLSLANALWLNRGFPANPTFASTLTDNYNATVENLDFSSQKALDTVNGWASKNTQGMIPTLFDRLEPDWIYILANAICFKGIWATQFNTDNTYREDFHCLSGEVRKTDFMHGEIPCGYAYDEKLGAALCELPFGNKAFMLDILLPDAGIDFTGFVEGLNADNWNALVADIRYSEKFVIIPKMDVAFSGTDSIKESLIALGMEDAFGPAADFSSLSEEPTYVSDVIQKARFKMDESGAEAAAVTAIIAKLTSAGPSSEFMADHPFVYAIREFSTGAILFMGACKNLQ